MVFNVINFAVVTRLVVSPLFRYIQSIKKEQAIPAEGAYELCYLANTYNEIYNRNAENEAILRREAERDAVTGIMNRSAFDHVTTRMTNADTPLALLLVDVDHFKSVNDTYGHSEGDAALKKVAQLLQSSFRATDYVARIGGDEFAVLMCNITPEQGDVIRSKVQRINEALRTESLAGHQLSISVGAAFSPNGYSKTLFENADQALYVVKENGRRGCAFYEKKAENDA
jgi:diguanylate cyclase (GGDEF)-like protein